MDLHEEGDSMKHILLYCVWLEYQPNPKSSDTINKREIGYISKEHAQTRADALLKLHYVVNTNIKPYKRRAV